MIRHRIRRRRPWTPSRSPAAQRRRARETLIRLGLSRRGVDGVELQVWVTRAHRVDLLLRGRLVIEVDGAQFHDPVRDALRDAELRSRGFVVLRLSYDRIVHDLEAVLDEVEAALLALEVA